MVVPSGILMAGCDSPIQASKSVRWCAGLTKTPDAHWVRRDVNILNKHTIPVIAINLLAAQIFLSGFFWWGKCLNVWGFLLLFGLFGQVGRWQ